jgi:hypothetical protein
MAFRNPAKINSFYREGAASSTDLHRRRSLRDADNEVQPVLFVHPCRIRTLCLPGNDLTRYLEIAGLTIASQASELFLFAVRVGS